ncbi:MAG TPA: FAD binding domain-containing protein [Anaerolineaceae bacterium]|nr:FAD binding domain-containing protein [Anaerolineaceae bacterium]
MIVEYHRPKTMEEALDLLGRTAISTYPLGGGTVLSRHSGNESCAVVDLQSLGLSGVDVQGNKLVIGATTSLQSLCVASELSLELKQVVCKEYSINLRRKATIAGTLVISDETSLLATALLALDTYLRWAPNDEIISLGNWLPIRNKWAKSKLITSVSITMQVKLMYESVSRTPADKPIVCVAIGKWPSGRTRIAIGGFGTAPFIVMDGPDLNDAETAIEIARSQAIKPENNLEYQLEITKTLVHRLLEQG